MLRITIVLFFLFNPFTAHAQETAESLADKLQEQFLHAPAVSFAFDLPSEGHIRIVADLKGGHIRMESPKLLIISDGKTVWNYDKSAKRETIDNVTNASAFRDPTALFRFADNYSARITAQTAQHYTLELTPNASMEQLFSAAGSEPKLVLQLQMEKSRVKIVSASAESSRGIASAEKLTINSVKKINPKEFEINVPASATVMDLRE